MIDKLPTLKQLIRNLQQVPYLASKNIYRVAQYFLEMENDRAELFLNTIKEARQRLVKCLACWSWKEKSQECGICADPKRDATLICVVETWQDLIALEKTGGYQGLYHVLGGAISPLDGIGPDELTIEPLIARVAQGNCREVILALNQTPEGEATAAFIAHKLQSTQVLVSCLARGVPVGAVLETMDRVTVYKALAERRPF